MREDQLRVIMADCDNLLQLGRGGRGELVQRSRWKGEKEGRREREEREREGGWGRRMRKREGKEREGSTRHKKPIYYANIHTVIQVYCCSLHNTCTLYTYVHTLSVTLAGFPCINRQTMVCSSRWALSTETTPTESKQRN